MKHIKKILVANRGEIALRIIRACRELGLKSVAIFSDPDRLMPFVQMADEAYSLNGVSSTDTYLRVDKIMEILEISGADAVHPGYGFLSENMDFSKKVKQAGKIFIGPDEFAIDMMGSKTNARKIAMKANVPCVPGTEAAIEDIAVAKTIALKIGYPILIKASAGGGGKGMRLVETEADFDEALRMAQNEAMQAFGDNKVYIEKFVEKPRHIEIQILGDSHGNMIYLGERECSIQRRHQKVIEEAPSAIITDVLRQQMGQDAIKCAKAVNYVSAGTVEFLVDKNLNYYFLEMNTRLQVEHPITELITGIDIVHEMIKIADGQTLSIKQEDIKINGHAIEVRIYAEDSYDNFLPSTGQISYLKAPDGPGIREDSGFEEGNNVTPFYDPMVSKLCAWGDNREMAIKRMKRALKEYQISGIKTTIPFCLLVLDHPEFRKAEYDTNFVKQHYQEMMDNEFNTEEWAAIAAAIIDIQERNHRKAVINSKDNNPWKYSHRQQLLRF